MDTSERQFNLEINGDSIFIKRSNDWDEDQHTIIYLHDSLGCVSLWRDFPDQVQQKIKGNYLVYDRVGHGNSSSMPVIERDNFYLEREAMFLADLIKALSLKKIYLLGHSDGGSIALITAAKFPELISGIIVEAAHIFVEEETLLGIEDSLHAYQNTNLAERLQKYHGSKAADVFDAWVKTWLNPTFRDWSIEYLLDKIQCPVLFIQGDKDNFGTIAQVEKTLEKAQVASTKAILPQTGHTPHKESPQETLKAIEKFWDIYGKTIFSSSIHSI